MTGAEDVAITTSSFHVWRQMAPMSEVKYHRLLLKLGGEALSGESGFGICLGEGLA